MTEAIIQTDPRRTVQVHLEDGRTFEGPKGTAVEAFVGAAYPDADVPIVAALIDGELHELNYPIESDVALRVLDTSSNDGMRIYQRSLSFLLVVAVHRSFPDAHVVIDHSVTLGGFFCQIDGHPPLEADQLQAIEDAMREMIDADLPIVKKRMTVQEALEMFAAQGYDDKVRLMEGYQGEHVTIYELEGVRDYFYGHMVTSTRTLGYFSLELYRPGFVMRLPSRQTPTQLPKPSDYPKLMRVFQRYGEWLSILGVEDVGSLNHAVDRGEVRKAILVAEALHEKRISDIADEIVRHHHQIRVVLVAGPSASGKTTFSRRLAIQLMVNGLRPFAIGLDDYFVDREKTPLDEFGEYNFEALEAIDIQKFNQQLLALMEGQRVQLPRFNFQLGRSEPGETVQLSEDTVIIVEGIHGLNPELVPNLPADSLYRLYVSALTQLNIDHHNRVPTTDTRLLRRTVRDARYRGYSAEQTIDRWESVRRGEERYIHPYQENADVMFNSALVYELAVLKPLAEPLLLRVPQGTEAFLEARRLLAFLRWVRPTETDLIPSNSLLREFVGGSILREFQF